MLNKKAHPLVKYLDVSVVSHDYDFLVEMIVTLEGLHVDELHCGMSLRYAEHLIRRQRADVFFLEFHQKYTSIWDFVRAMPSLPVVVVAITQERSTRARLSAVHAGAERVIAKDQACTLVEPMLVHLLEGDLARRFRVVPFPEGSIR